MGTTSATAHARAMDMTKSTAQRAPTDSSTNRSTDPSTDGSTDRSTDPSTDGSTDRATPTDRATSTNDSATNGSATTTSAGPDRQPRSHGWAPSSFSSSAVSAPRPLSRPDAGRIIAGVAAGLAAYAGVDVAIVRVVLAVLAVTAGVGIPLYLAAWLLIPAEGSGQSIAAGLVRSVRTRSA